MLNVIGEFLGGQIMLDYATSTIKQLNNMFNAKNKNFGDFHIHFTLWQVDKDIAPPNYIVEGDLVFF